MFVEFSLLVSECGRHLFVSITPCATLCCPFRGVFMVVQQVSTNSWYESARAAYNEPAKQKFLKDLAAALASNDSAVYAPPLRQIMRIGQAVGGDRLAQVLATALLRSADTTKDERLAEALLDLAANGSQAAQVIVQEVAKADSGYVVARAWYQRLLDNCSYKVDYAVGKDLSAISKRVDILKDAGLQAISAPTNADERISEIRAAIIGYEKHLEYASSRLAWFFVHGTDGDRLSLQAAIREYADHSSDKKAVYRKKIVSIKKGVVALLDAEIEFAREIKDKESLTKLNSAKRAFEGFFAGEEQVISKPILSATHQASPVDLLREELQRTERDLDRIGRLVKKVGAADVIEVVRPIVICDNP